MDQQYNYSPRDFVTVSARADAIEYLAGQESEILNVGPEPERATVTVPWMLCDSLRDYSVINYDLWPSFFF